VNIRDLFRKEKCMVEENSFGRTALAMKEIIKAIKSMVWANIYRLKVKCSRVNGRTVFVREKEFLLLKLANQSKAFGIMVNSLIEFISIN